MRHSEFAYDRYTLKFWRKALHVSSSWIGLVYIYAGIPHPVTIVILGALTLVFLGIDLARFLHPGFAAFCNRTFNGLFIERDRNRPNSATWYLVSVFLVVLVFGGETRLERLVAGIPVLLLAWGDTAASVFGKLYGRRRIPLLKGTWIGFLACAGAAMLVMLCFQLLDPALPGWWWLVPAIGFLTALAEALPLPLDDNLTIVVLTGIFLYFSLF